MGNAFMINYIEPDTDTDTDIHEPLYSEAEIAEIIADLAAEINIDYENSTELVLICASNDSMIFMADLTRKIIIPHQHQYITSNSNESLNLTGKDVIIVDVIVDTGLKLKNLVEKILTETPKSVECCVLFNKFGKREHDIDIKYLGTTIDNQYVIGYGLALNEKYRNLPFIANGEGEE